MSQPLLSILIPTTPERQVEFDRLLDRLEILSAGYSVKIISDDTGKQMTIGEKRERLYKAANGLYSWQIDDDDDIAEIDRLVAERVAARAAKDYTLSDKLRDELAARGVEVMDGASGSTWRRKG